MSENEDSASSIPAKDTDEGLSDQANIDSDRWLVVSRDDSGRQVIRYNPFDQSLELVSNVTGGALLSPSHVDREYNRLPSTMMCCPTCHRPFTNGNTSRRSFYPSRDYFSMLCHVHQSEQHHTRNHASRSFPQMITEHALSSGLFANGYFDRFFRVRRILGHGSNGQVLLAEHRLQQTALGLFAVKIVPIGDDRKWLDKRLGECGVMAQLHHPNIVDYKHAWVEEEFGMPGVIGPPIPCLFIVMEYASEGSLEEKILETTGGDNGYLDEDYFNLLMGWVSDAAKGLAHLHHHGIIHTDLKPSNILICSAERAVLSDLGESRFYTNNSSINNTVTSDDLLYMGTEGFIAPEVASGDASFSTKSDIWSLGLVLSQIVGRDGDKRLAGMTNMLKKLVGAMLHEDPATRPDIDTVVCTLGFLLKSNG